MQNFFNFKKQKVIVFYGSKGWIGSLFMDYIKKNYPSLKVIEGSSRIDNRIDILIELGVHRPTHVISFTGRTHGVIDGEPIGTIDYLEYPGRLTENICDNLFGPVQLAQICEQKDIHYTYLGTGCIFNSERIDSPISPVTFSEEDLPNYFGSSYSVVKGFTDRLMHNYHVLNLRIRMPISTTCSPRNFINKITSYKKICSISNSMTVLDDFFPIFMDLILKEKTGTWNCTNPGTISHDEILKMYRQFVQPDFTWENFTIEEQKLVLKSDRSNNALDTTKLEDHYKIDNIYDSVKRVLQKFK
jgi:3,5-epimerase/4-reductase